MNAVVRKTAPIARTLLQVPVRSLARKESSRRLLNDAYNAVPSRYYSAIHFFFAKMFSEETRGGAQPGSWQVHFAGTRVDLPITAERLWLDWDTALSIVGHDSEVKQTYLNLLGSATPPDLFIDIGANYGTHSLLFLKHGIATFTFEPNPSCHGYFREACALNQVTPQLEGVALSDSEGTAELRFPERETWLGSLSEVPAGFTTLSHTVPVKTLDSWLPRFQGRKNVLVKIDTEGYELYVVRGARRVLRECRPIVVFESLPNEELRSGLYKELADAGYGIALLPWNPGSGQGVLSEVTFISERATNFAAFPLTGEMPR